MGAQSRRAERISVLSETGEAKVFEERVGEASILALRLCRRRWKGSALRYLAGSLYIDGGERTLSVGREVKMKIPDYGFERRE
jgi:hypothetical protein